MFFLFVVVCLFVALLRTPLRRPPWGLGRSGARAGSGASSRSSPQQQLTHKVGGGLADSTPEDEILEQVGDEVERHAEKAEHEVTDCQREQKDVGDGSHPLVPNQHCNDQRIAQHAEQEYQGVQENLHSWLPLCEEEQGRDRGTEVMGAEC